MNQTVIHVVGHVGTDLSLREIGAGTQRCDFRLAATPRRYDRVRHGFVDEATNWWQVQCWRSLAVHVSRSLHKGDPVVVVGKLKTQEWEQEGKRHSRLILEATAVGHDLSRGVATFTKATTPELVNGSTADLESPIAALQSSPQ
jgi:single-strand DNA-binding protein